MRRRFGWPRWLRRSSELDCPEVRDLSSDYVEEELTGSLRTRVQEHLDRCGACRSFVETLRSTIRMLRELPTQKAPPELRDSIRKRVRGAGAE